MPAAYVRWCRPVRLAVGEDGELVEVPEQQHAIRIAKALRGKGLSLRATSAAAKQALSAVARGG
jgi:hypothetical protein